MTTQKKKVGRKPMNPADKKVTVISYVRLRHVEEFKAEIEKLLNKLKNK
jgi:hypothetical protein